MCSKTIKLSYVHEDTSGNVTFTGSSNRYVNIITHVFDLQGTEKNSQIFLSSTVYQNNNILTNVNTENTIKINDKGCITFSIPIFFVDNNNFYYINQKETTPIISKITSGSGMFSNVKGYVKTIFKKNVCYMTIKFDLSSSIKLLFSSNHCCNCKK